MIRLMMPKMAMLLPMGTSELRRARWISVPVKTRMASSETTMMTASRFLLRSSLGGMLDSALSGTAAL